MIDRWLAWACGAAMALFVVGCGGDDGSSNSGAGAAGGGGSPAGSGGNGGNGGNGATASGDCETSADCGGDPCVELTPGGYRVCQIDYPEASSCLDPSIDECCTTADCAFGSCYATPIVPFCGGAEQQPFNVCVADQCADDAACGAGSICAPAGTLARKVRACAPASCKVNADCTAEPSGVCAPVVDPCCGYPAGLHCVYPGGCRSNTDCPGGYCELGQDGATRCMTGAPICPL